MFRSYKFRLFPNRNQTRELEATLETHRRLYNECLDDRQFVYDTTGHSLTFAEQSRRFTFLKKSNPYYARLNVTSAEATIKRIDKAYGAFFRRLKQGTNPGFPRFKSADRFNSWTYRMPKGGGAKIIDEKLRLQHIGTLRIKLHRPMKGKVKTIQILREAGKWFAVFTCELDSVPSIRTGPPVGIDVGLESFLTTSAGDHEPNPRFLKELLPKLRKEGRSVSRKRKGGTRRRKAVKKLQRTHARVRSLRRDHHHKVALKLVSRYGFIAAESLNVSNMLRNRRLSRAISDAGWSGFLNVLRCKAENAGAQFVEVDARGTSQTCTCGQRVEKTLSARRHECPSCGLVLHRDHVSAKVILARGLARAGLAEYKFGVA